MGRPVALGPQRLAGDAVAVEAGTEVDQQVAGLGGEPGGQRVIVGADDGHAVPCIPDPTELLTK